MADLDFKHHVAQIPAQAELPESHRTTGVEIGNVPDYQSAISNYAASTNWLSGFGSLIASSASTALASKLGAQLGQNPQGDLTPPITNFDKTLSQSYQTQAQATLAIQANKLITDSHIEVAQANRITPELISRTNQKISLGLNNIFQNAPSEIRSQLEYQYKSQQIHQTAELTNKMISQQRIDRNDNTSYASEVNSEAAYTAAYRNQLDIAKEILDTTIRMNQSDVEAIGTKKEVAKTRIDTVRQSMLIGEQNRKYDDALKEHKEDQFLKELLINRPKNIPESDYQQVVKGVLNHATQSKALIAESQQIAMTQFQQDLLVNPSGNHANKLIELKSILNPSQYEAMVLKFLKIKEKLDKNKKEQNILISNFSNPEIYGRSTAKIKNDTFDQLTANLMESSQKAGKPLTLDMAETSVAAIAAGPIPSFIDIMNSKLRSTDPSQIESAGHSIQYLTTANKAANLEGLSDNAKNMWYRYNSLKNSKSPQESALQAYQEIYEPKPETKSILEQNWLNELNIIKNSGKLNFYSNLIGFNKNQIIDRIGFEEQVETMLRENFFKMHGDMEAAKNRTRDETLSVYGETYINGPKQYTFYPLEQVFDLPSSALPFIQDDIIEFINHSIKTTNEAFSKGIMPYYWEIAPRLSKEQKEKILESRKVESPLQSLKSESRLSQLKSESRLAGIEVSEFKSLKREEAEPAIIIYKHWANGVRETYPVIVKSNPFLSRTADPTKPYNGGWDIVLGNGKQGGYINFNLDNPILPSNLVYQPDKKKVTERYNQKLRTGT